MFANDTAYRVRQVRDAVRIGYSLDDGLSKAFGPFRYQQRGAQWDAVQRWLEPALALPQDERHAQQIERAVDDAYRLARRAAAI